MVAVAITLCYLATLGTEAGAPCEEIVITRSATMMECAMGVGAIAEWKAQSHIYRGDEYKVTGWTCEQEDYQPKRGA